MFCFRYMTHQLSGISFNVQSLVTQHQNPSSGLWEEGSTDVYAQAQLKSFCVCYVVCVSVHLHMCIDRHVHEHRWRTKVDIWCLP